MNLFVIGHNGGFLNFDKDDEEHGWLQNDFGEAEHNVFPSIKLAEEEFEDALSGEVKLNENATVDVFEIFVDKITEEDEKQPYTENVSYFVQAALKGKYGLFELYDFASNEKTDLGWIPISNGYPANATQYGDVKSVREILSENNIINDLVESYVIYKIKLKPVKRLK